MVPDDVAYVNMWHYIYNNIRLVNYLRKVKSMDYSGKIQFKGEGEHIRLIVSENIPAEFLHEAINLAIDKAGKLVGGVPLILDFKSRQLVQDDIFGLLSNVVCRRHLKIKEWRSSNEESRELFSSMGFKTQERGRLYQGRGTLFVHRSLRSGKTIEHDGDVIVLGNVNEGAEIYATGSICVWGRLCGLAHAGCEGKDDVFIVAGCFDANQVRISDKISYVGPDTHWIGKSVKVYVAQGVIAVSELSG